MLTIELIDDSFIIDCERSEAKRSFASLRSQESFMLVYRGKLMYAYLENEAFFEYVS